MPPRPTKLQIAGLWQAPTPADLPEHRAGSAIVRGLHNGPVVGYFAIRAAAYILTSFGRTARLFQVLDRLG